MSAKSLDGAFRSAFSSSKIGRLMFVHCHSLLPLHLSNMFRSGSDVDRLEFKGEAKIFGESFDLDDAKSSAAFLERWNSFLWVTYRKEFDSMKSANDERGYTSDAGWGCALRSGQMLLAETVSRHLPGLPFERLVSLFRSSASLDAAFSVHRMTACGEIGYAKHPGEWFGPSTVSCILRDLVYNSAFHERLRVVVCANGALFLDEISREARVDVWLNANDVFVTKPRDHDDVSPKRSLLFLLPLRFGLSRLLENPTYRRVLTRFISLPSCVGCVGGRPGRSLYFVGTSEGSSLLYLDPHTVQSASASSESFKPRSPLRLDIGALDPSLSIGFYVDDPVQDLAPLLTALHEASDVVSIAATRNAIRSTNTHEPETTSGGFVLV